jgi:hypothetical protein
LRFGAVVLASSVALGCEDDEEQTSTDAGDAAASSNGDGGHEAAKVDQTSPDVATGDATADRVEASPSDATDASDGATGDAIDSEAGDAGTKPYGMFVATDYGTSAKLAVVDLTTNQAAGTVLPVTGVPFGDVKPYASGGRGFLLDRSNGKVIVLDRTQPWDAQKTFTFSVEDGDAEAGAAPANPYAVVVAAASKAYVVRYGSNRVLVVDIDTGTVTGTVDLSPFVQAGDPDGLVETWDGVFDPAKGRVYFLLQRIDQTNRGLDPDRVSQCLPFGPTIVGIDVSNDHVVNLGNSDGGSPGLSLLGQNPQSLVPDLANGRFLVVESGCYEAPEGGAVDPDAGATYSRKARGIEAIDLATGHSSWLYEHAQADRLADLILIDATHAYVERTDENYQNHWYGWDPTATTLGPEIATFPENGFYDQGRVVGFSTNYVEGGTALSVVAYDVGSGQTSTLIADLFGDKTLNAYATAVIR